MLKEKIIPVLKDVKTHLKWLIAIHIAFYSVPFYTTLYNSLDVIPPSLTFTVVLLNRSLLPIGFAMGLIYLIGCKPKSEEKESQTTRDQEEESVTFKPLKGFSRLSFSLYICNYLVIRTLFFTTRNPFPTTFDGSVS